MSFFLNHKFYVNRIYVSTEHDFSYSFSFSLIKTRKKLQVSGTSAPEGMWLLFYSQRLHLQLRARDCYDPILKCINF